MQIDKSLIPCINAIMEDEEFLYGGIFQKEEEIMEKYNLTKKQISNLQTLIYFALSVRDDELIEEKLYK